MGLNNKLREVSFWIIDFLKSSKIKKQYKDIVYVLENYTDEKSNSKREAYLQKVLKHAKATVPYYKNKTVDNFKDFPVIDKNVVRNNFEDFKSDSYQGKKIYPAYTSGSTGTPFRVFHNKEKKIRNTADTLYFAQKGGYTIGQKLYYLRHWDQYNKKSVLGTFMKNIVMHPVSELTDKDIWNLIEKMKADPEPKSILGYASALANICNYMVNTNAPKVDANVRSIIAMSEHLSPNVKEQLHHYFGVEGLSRYSNVENGIIAQQFPGSNTFHINWASYFVEILEIETDVPVKSGNPGRIVVTDLFNYSMPLIRYDTGDIGVMKDNDPFNEAPYLEHVEGRKMDMIYNTSGELITSYVTYHLLKYPKIKQFQFIQENKNTYLFILNVYKGFDLEQQIIEEFKAHLGADAVIKVEYANDIPLLQSGKRKLVVNKMFPHQ
ncbi:CoF synthetase [Galbibacter sp. EGI 63066]|uniref:CoF synthetase n=1 Tax=Galbibacter sp. EGI 63066 TaxID=2993559 RepID=UPI0022491CAA|nr:CoF synthetase [Galbibacter sp. EGI 63066]MCX2679174.1 CoF synthetase [Galbibacter sp. EGI 63066]